MEKIIAVVLHEAYNQQVEEAMDALAEGSENFYEKVLKAPRDEDKTD